MDDEEARMRAKVLWRLSKGLNGGKICGIEVKSSAALML
jgi:hypothetical protein